MAAMGKVPVAERVELDLVLQGAFPILTFLFPPIDFAGTMKKVRPFAPFCAWAIMGGANEGRPQETPAVGMALC